MKVLCHGVQGWSMVRGLKECVQDTCTCRWTKARNKVRVGARVRAAKTITRYLNLPLYHYYCERLDQ